MKHAPIVALALAAAFVAGCGGDSISRAQYDEVVKERDDAIEERDTAQTERDTARTERDTARTERDTARTERDTARTERDTAQTERDDLEEEAGHTADQLVQANARQVRAGLNLYLADTDNTGTDVVGTADPTVTPRYRQSALVTTNPPVTFSSTTTGTSGNWFRSSFSHRGGTNYDRLDVYSDVQPPTSVPFKDSTYKDETAGEAIVGLYDPSDATPTEVVDNNKVVGSVSISASGGQANRPDAAASQFPRSGDPRKDFDQTDRGFTQTEFDALADDATRAEAAGLTEAQFLALATNADTGDDAEERFGKLTRLHRNLNRYPLRFTSEVSGTLGRASGTYTCASAAATDCRVTNQNTHFRFHGPWVFTPSSATSAVRVDDAEFMYFGWWARQANSDGSWTFRTFHGPTTDSTDTPTGNRSTGPEISQLSGTATYVGPAVGQYSFYQPLTAQSEYGEFSATATLRANFDNDMVDGTIDQFDKHDDWTLTLNHRTISAGIVPPTAATGDDHENAVSWQIDGEAVAAPDSGTWEAAFYSNLPASQRTTTTEDEDAVPTGMAGTFEAQYHNIGTIVGAFGAHKQP